MEYRQLYNGVRMPMLGYGVYQIDSSQTERCVLDAIDCGYRLIDTAQAYGNEEVPSIVFRTFVSQGPVPVAGASSVS